VKKISKAAAFAKANRELAPKPLWLQFDEKLGGKRNPHGRTFDVNERGQLTIDSVAFSPKDALRLAAWLQENFG
jgi:hypothetical protein